MKIRLFFVLIALTTISNAQSIDSLSLKKQEFRMAYLEKQISNIRVENNALRKNLSNLEQKTNELCLKLNATDSTISNVDENYGTQLKQTNTTIQANQDKQQKSVLWGIVLVIVLASITIAVYLILRKRIAKKSDDIEQLRTRADEINQQMVERMDKELDELQKIASAATASAIGTGNNDAEPDHSLIVALADRITFMEMTLYKMDSSVKGHKQLSKSIKNMKDNLLANGYELVDMLGKEYAEGMKVSPSFNDDESIELGKRIITGITKPQINYKGQMIQPAQITVSQNI